MMAKQIAHFKVSEDDFLSCQGTYLKALSLVYKCSKSSAFSKAGGLAQSVERRTLDSMQIRGTRVRDSLKLLRSNASSA